MNNGGILPQNEWLAKHKPKFDREGLSKRERLRRYTDYASESAAKVRALNTRERVARKVSHGVAPGKTSRDELIKAMIDPFTACSAEGTLPRIPDGTLRSTGVFKFKFNVDVYSNAQGRACVFVANSPFRTYVASQTSSNVDSGDGDYVSQVEYDAYSAHALRAIAGTGNMPAWSKDSWCIPTVTTALSGTTDTSIGFQNASGYTALLDLAQAWRPICMGMKFTNTSRVTNRSGSVAVARWPGALGVPCVSNPLLVVNGSAINGATFTGYEGQGPNFATVQSLPTAEVLAVTEGFKAVWAPESTEGQAFWRPTHPKPFLTAQTISGLEQFSDTETTGVLILPEPANGDPERYMALIDRVYGMNAACGGSNVLGNETFAATNIPMGLGTLQGLYFQNWASAANGGTVASNDTITSYALRDILHGHNEASMLVDDTALIAVFEGCEPSVLLGTMEIVLGIEYIADSRVVSTGNGPNVARVEMSKSKQLDVHHATVAALQRVPAVVERGPSVIGQIVGAANTVAGVAQTAAPYVEMALEALAAFV